MIYFTHYDSRLLHIANILQQANRPSAKIGRTAVVTKPARSIVIRYTLYVNRLLGKLGVVQRITVSTRLIIGVDIVSTIVGYQYRESRHQ